jgi:hypothetical protein
MAPGGVVRYARIAESEALDSFFELKVGNGCRKERTEPKAAGREEKKMKISLLDAKGPQKPVR